MKKIIIKTIKVIIIVMIYVLIFWGLIKGGKTLIHKLNKNNCTCDQTVKVVEVFVDVPKEEAKTEPKKETVNTTKKSTTKKVQNVQPVITGSKADYQAYAHDLILNQYLWSEEDYQALINLWERESNWNPNAVNKSSGACNIPQALPCNKIINKYGDNSWQSGIKWGLGYIKDRYDTPVAAWQHFEQKNWY